MIQPTTLKGTKDILVQYSGNEYCIIYEELESTLGYWLVETLDMENCVKFNDLETTRKTIWKPCNCGSCSTDYELEIHFPEAIAHIPEHIMLQLINEGVFAKSMTDKEWSVQIALGTAPAYRPYLIPREVA